MSLVTRTAMLAARVRPEIKFASEDVLRRIGLNMTEAMELFLCRVIAEQKLPFEVIAMDERTYLMIVEAWKNDQNNELSIGSGVGSKRKKMTRKKK